MPCFIAGPTQAAARAGEVRTSAMPELGSGVSVNEICIAVLLSNGLPFFFIGCRKVFFTFFCFPLTLTFLVLDLNAYWHRGCFARPPYPAGPASPHAACV